MQAVVAEHADAQQQGDARGADVGDRQAAAEDGVAPRNPATALAFGDRSLDLPARHPAEAPRPMRSSHAEDRRAATRL